MGKGVQVGAAKKEGSVAVNAAARVAMYAINLLVPVLVGPYVARVLDVGAYAEYNAALSVMQVFLALAAFGIHIYGVRQASRVRDDLERTSAVFEPLYRFGILTALLSWLLFAAFALLFQTERRGLYLVLGLQVLFNAYAVEWVNEAFESYPFILCKTAAVRLLYVAGVFLCVRRAEDILPFALVSGLAVFLNHFFGFLYIRRRVKRRTTRLKELTPLIKPLAVMFLFANVNVFYLMLDRLYLSAFSTNRAYVSYYTLPMLIMVAVMNVLSSLLFVAVPRLTHRLAQGDREGYENLLSSSSHAFFLIAIPACMGLGALGPQMMLLYGGARYEAAGMTLMLFGLRFAVNAYDLSLSYQALLPHGMEKEIVRIYLLGGLINLAFKAALLAFKLFDPVLCIATTALCDAFAVALEQRMAKKRLGVTPLDGAALRYAAYSLGFYPVCALLRRAFSLSGSLDAAFFQYLLASIGSCAALYLGALFFTRDRHFISLSSRLVSRLKSLPRRVK